MFSKNPTKSDTLSSQIQYYHQVLICKFILKISLFSSNRLVSRSLKKKKRKERNARFCFNLVGVADEKEKSLTGKSANISSKSGLFSCHLNSRSVRF